MSHPPRSAPSSVAIRSIHQRASPPEGEVKTHVDVVLPLGDFEGSISGAAGIRR